MTSHEKHNELVRKFMLEVVKETDSLAAMMVVFESVLTGSMIFINKYYGLSKPAAAEMMEQAMIQATERFSQS